MLHLKPVDADGVKKIQVLNKTYLTFCDIKQLGFDDLLLQMLIRADTNLGNILLNIILSSKVMISWDEEPYKRFEVS